MLFLSLSLSLFSHSFYSQFDMNEVNTGNNSYTEWLLSTSSLLFNKRRMENWVSRHSCQQWNQWSQWSNLSLVSPRRASFNERKVSMWPPLDTHTRRTETSFLSVNESPFWFDYQLLSWKRDSFFNSWLSFPSSIMIQSSLRKHFSLWIKGVPVVNHFGRHFASWITK